MVRNKELKRLKEKLNREMKRNAHQRLERHRQRKPREKQTHIHR